jgi:RNA recognition motif-containing protein
MMGHKIYVGSLPFETTETQLTELFTACGRVESAKIIMDRATGRSRGFGFVEMATALEAEAAIQKFNGSALGSRNIVVKEARPMEDRKPGPGPGGNGGGFKPRPPKPQNSWGNGGGGNRWGGGQGQGGNREWGDRSERRDRGDRRDTRHRDQGGWNNGGQRKRGPSSGPGGRPADDDNFGNR